MKKSREMNLQPLDMVLEPLLANMTRPLQALQKSSDLEENKPEQYVLMCRLILLIAICFIFFPIHIVIQSWLNDLVSCLKKPLKWFGYVIELYINQHFGPSLSKYICNILLDLLAIIGICNKIQLMHVIELTQRKVKFLPPECIIRWMLVQLYVWAAMYLIHNYINNSKTWTEPKTIICKLSFIIREYIHVCLEEEYLFVHRITKVGLRCA